MKRKELKAIPAPKVKLETIHDIAVAGKGKRGVISTQKKKVGTEETLILNVYQTSGRNKRDETVKLMVVVTNLGNVSYLVKNSKYDFEKAVVLLNEAIDLNNKAKNIKDLQEAADYFLKSCYNVGINYEKR